MLYAFFAFVLFLIVMQVAVYMLPLLLILIFAGWIYTLIARPKIKVYTHTFSFPSSMDMNSMDMNSMDKNSMNMNSMNYNEPASRRGFSDKMDSFSQRRLDGDNVIDAEFSEQDTEL